MPAVQAGQRPALQPARTPAVRPARGQRYRPAGCRSALDEFIQESLDNPPSAILVAFDPDVFDFASEVEGVAGVDGQAGEFALFDRSVILVDIE